MNHINTKRLLKDIKDFVTNNLESHGIYYQSMKIIFIILEF